MAIDILKEVRNRLIQQSCNLSCVGLSIDSPSFVECCVCTEYCSVKMASAYLDRRRRYLDDLVF